MTSPHKIVIRCPNWLGDLMMSTAFVDRVLERFPTASVDLIVKKGFERLPLPHRGKIIPFDKNAQSTLAFAKELKEHHRWDRFYILPPSFSAALMAWGTGTPERIGHKEGWRSWLLKPAIAYAEEHRSRHLITEYLELLSPQEPTAYPKLLADQAWSAQILKDHAQDLGQDYIALCPGAIYGPAKQWPVSHFAELARMLVEAGEKVVILGQEEDFDQPMPELERTERFVNHCGKSNLLEFVALLSRAKLLVSNDSGSMHVMAALGKPQIAIFGSTSQTWTGPINRLARIVQDPMDCSPCFSRTCPLGHYQCLTQIEPERIFKMIKELPSSP